MSVYPVKLPDVGEGVAEAELVEWFVEVGDTVTPESPLAEVLTDKATVEISSPVAGVVVALHGTPGDVLAVGSELVGIETASEAQADDASEDDEVGEEAPPAEKTMTSEPAVHAPADGPGEPPTDESPDRSPVESPIESPDESPDRSPVESPDTPPPAGATKGSLAAPAVRGRARDLGIDLAAVGGTGPDGRVVHADLDRLLVRRGSRATTPSADSDDVVHDEPVRGVRRRIAERLSAAWSEIPHITYVEAVDVTELEALRGQLNRADGVTRLTMLPFLVRAVATACREQPRLNAHYDHDARTLSLHEAVHVGIATQTDDGLMVPVVRHAGARSLRDLAAEIAQVTAAAREGRATREQLSGSTITITSLGALGGLVTTPIINRPEVAIIGVNKLETRPVWTDGSFQPRKVVNLSSSFDHRMVDGWDAATFVQRIRTLLESPALLFVDDE